MSLTSLRWIFQCNIFSPVSKLQTNCALCNISNPSAQFHLESSLGLMKKICNDGVAFRTDFFTHCDLMQDGAECNWFGNCDSAQGLKVLHACSRHSFNVCQLFAGERPGPLSGEPLNSEPRWPFWRHDFSGQVQTGKTQALEAWNETRVSWPRWDEICEMHFCREPLEPWKPPGPV